MKIVVICGNAREGSFTETALKEVVHFLEKEGVEAKFISLKEYSLPLFNGEEYNHPNAMKLREIATEADGFILGTPDYHGSFSAALKNMLEYLVSDHFNRKPVGILATAGGGKGGVNALNGLRITMRSLYANVVPKQVIVDSQTKGEKGIADEDVLKRIQEMCNDVLYYAKLAKK